MKVSELSSRSDVSVSSIKYYVREGLLAAGHPTAANQATYDEQHLRRLRLIRALIDIGGLPIASVRAVLEAVDSDTTSLHDAFGSVMHALDAAPPTDMDAELAAARNQVLAWLRARKWSVKPHAPAIQMLAEALLTLRRFDFGIGLDGLDGVADAAEQMAEFEVLSARNQSDRTASVEHMLLGTVVYGQALTEIRRLALEAVSARADKPTKGRRAVAH